MRCCNEQLRQNSVAGISVFGMLKPDYVQGKDAARMELAEIKNGTAPCLSRPLCFADTRWCYAILYADYLRLLHHRQGPHRAPYQGLERATIQ